MNSLRCFFKTKKTLSIRIEKDVSKCKKVKRLAVLMVSGLPLYYQLVVKV